MLKQFTGIERGQFRLERSQRNHIGLALRAYVRLELHRWKTRVSICASKLTPSEIQSHRLPPISV